MPEDDVQGDARQVGVRLLLQPEGDARNDLVLAVDDAGVVPAAGGVGDFERLLDVDRAAAAGEPASAAGSSNAEADGTRANIRRL